jgi:surface protein
MTIKGINTIDNMTNYQFTKMYKECADHYVHEYETYVAKVEQADPHVLRRLNSFTENHRLDIEEFDEVALNDIVTSYLENAGTTIINIYNPYNKEITFQVCDLNADGVNIEWGDGTCERSVDLENFRGILSHKYEENGDGFYRITINGPFKLEMVKSSDGYFVDKHYVYYQIVNWGNMALTSYSFESCFASTRYKLKIDISAKDSPALSTCLSHLFAGSMVIKGGRWNISNWDVSKVTDMSHMFQGTVNFDGLGLDAWDVSSVTNMNQMFFESVHFNGDLSRWDVRNVTDMSYMFEGAFAFQGGDLSGWDVSSVTNMSNMFCEALSFNGDLSRWDVSSVTNMSDMFHKALNFNGDLSRWDVSSVTNMGYMFKEACSFNGDISRWRHKQVGCE